jgi:transcriptional regulator with XRE-family HTH domain
MGNHDEVKHFLVTMRGRTCPGEAGIPTWAGERRVPGLRREEVADLAGISVSYYTRIERGDLTGVSESVLNALSRALQLSETERLHLFHLAREAYVSPLARKPEASIDLSKINQLLLAMNNFPVIVSDRYGDILAFSRGAMLLFPDYFPEGEQPVNLGRNLYLQPESRVFLADWETPARNGTEFYRYLLGQFPTDQKLIGLIGEFRSGSAEFEKWWTSQEVRTLDESTFVVDHPRVGRMEVWMQMMHLSPTNQGVFFSTYFAQPGTPSADAMKALLTH